MTLTLILIYIIGYIFAFIQVRKNDSFFGDERRTNKDMLVGMLYSLFSWGCFFYCLAYYLYHAKLPKFKYWLSQTSKF